MASRLQAERRPNITREQLKTGATVAALAAAGALVAGLRVEVAIALAVVIVIAERLISRLRRRHAAAHGYGPTPTNLKLLGYGMLVIPVLLAVAYAGQRVTNHQLQNSLRAATVRADAASATAPPGGFAGHCLELWLAAGPKAAGERFAAACNPGIEPSELEGMTAGTLQATGTTALIGPGLSFQTDPGYYSVLLATQLRSFENGKFADLGPAYFRVAVISDTHGHLALRGLPRQVASPVAASVPDLQAQLSTADLDDPRTALISDLLTRYLKAPPPDKPRAGDIGQYLAPDVKATTVHSPAIMAVTVTKTAYTDPPEGERTTRALAEVKVTYMGGRSAVQTYPLEMVQPGTGQWQVTSMPGTPQVNP